MPRRAASEERLAAPFALAQPLIFRRSKRARRITLRIDLARGCVVLVAPLSAGRKQAMDFLSRHQAWLAVRLARLPQARPFAAGLEVPVLGVPHRIDSDPSTLRGVVRRADGVIVAPGATEHLPRRVGDFLKIEAKREISARAHLKAARIGRSVAAVTLRDTRSRWGSCNSAGRLGFSWRLIMAPEFVLDYVVAHEVAHLVEMNHGPRFWRLCRELTETDPQIARAWLKRHGPELHAFR